MTPSAFPSRVLLTLATLAVLTAVVCAVRRSGAIREAGADFGAEATEEAVAPAPALASSGGEERGAVRRRSPAVEDRAKTPGPAVPSMAASTALVPAADAAPAVAPAALPDLLAGAAAEAAGDLADDPRVREFAESITRGRGGSPGQFAHIESTLALSEGQRELYREIAADYVRAEAAAYAAFLRGTLGEAERAAQTAWARQWAESRVAAYLDDPQRARFDTMRRFGFVRPDNRAALTAVRGRRGERPVGAGPAPVDGIVAPPPSAPPSGSDGAPRKASG